MQRGFTKLFNTIVTSTIWQEDDKTRIVWITMLAIADANGIVGASIPGLASVSNVSVNATRAAVKTLLEPDADSRTKDFAGRRIEEIDGGWRILNYMKYRRMLNEEERKEYKAKWIANRRDVDKSRQPSTLSTQAEAEAEAEGDRKADKRKRKPLSLAECVAYARTRGISASDAEAFFDSQESGGWTRSGKALRDWEAALRTWKSNGWLASQRQSGNGKTLIRFQDRKKRREQIQDDLNSQFKAAEKDNQGRAIFTAQEHAERSKLYDEMEKLT